MMKHATFLTAVLLMAFAATQAQNTSGTATFTVTTLSNSGKYDPKHVLAIWLKDSTGTFIRTLKLRATQESKYLYQWKTSSGLNTTDAITGATLTSHQTHSVTWNCKNLSNAVVPNGTYDFWIEFTDKDGQGPYTHYSFSKGTAPVSLTFQDQSKFINVSLAYSPDPSGVEETGKDNKVSVTYNDKSYTFQVPGGTATNSSLKVFNLQGQLVHESATPVVSGNKVLFSWEPDQAKGIYLYRITSGNRSFSGKLANAR